MPEQRAAREHEPDVAPVGGHVCAVRVVIPRALAAADATAIRAQQAGEAIQRRRLAGSALPDDRNGFTRFDFDREIKREAVSSGAEVSREAHALTRDCSMRAPASTTNETSSRISDIATATSRSSCPSM